MTLNSLFHLKMNPMSELIQALTSNSWSSQHWDAISNSSFISILLRGFKSHLKGASVKTIYCSKVWWLFDLYLHFECLYLIFKNIWMQVRFISKRNKNTSYRQCQEKEVSWSSTPKTRQERRKSKRVGRPAMASEWRPCQPRGTRQWWEPHVCA